MNQKPGLKCVGGTALAEKPKQAGFDNKQVTLPEVLQKVRNRAFEDLHQMLEAMFYQADDMFFEYARKAGDSSSQDACLEVMREFRLKRKEFEKSLFTDIAKRFKNLASNVNGGRPSLESVGGLDGLSLMDTEEVEQSVAIETMVSKARDAFGTSLYQLHTRLDALMIQATVDKSNNPLDPQQICESFKQATQVVECEIKYRLIFFKLFQRYVLDSYDRLIDNCNFFLAKSGVLPDLKGTPTKLRKASMRKAKAKAPAEQVAAGSASAQVAASSMEAANEFFAQLQGLLASVRDMTNAIGAAAGPIGSLSAQAREVASSELMGMLSNIQSAQPRGEDILTGAVQARLNVRNTLTNLLKQQEASVGPQKVGQADTDVINLVSMLFEFILDDENLPVQVKALIGRLQIPYLKVAIADKSFLNAGAHPARKLLNELARAGIGLNDQSDQIINDMVFKKITDVVQKVLNDFSDDISLFNTVLADFSEFMQREVRRSEMIEHRTKAAEEGRVLSETAKKEVALALKEKVEGRLLPTVVAKIIDGPWSNYLYLIYLKQGSESKAWAVALKTVDQLISSVSPVQNEVDKKTLFNIVPALLKSLRAGFSTISLNPFETGELLNDLEQIQMQVLRGEKPEYMHDIDKGEEPTDKLLDAVAKDMAPEADEPEEENQSPIVHHTDKVARLDITKKIQEAPKPELPTLSNDDEHWKKVQQLQVGAWLELTQNEQKVRCKLAAHIKSADKMIFVNRSGVKVLEKTQLEIAYDLKSEKLLMLDDSLLFDRALENVIANLRNVRSKD
ncbi:MAG: DUF1631 domain-containing protein [Pseudomonadales bacterium]|nr:DUF1631 domain-containing protein [Pseudomonadales bacterium]